MLVDDGPEISISTCYTCLNILCDEDGNLSIKRLEQLLSDPGIDVTVSPTAWRQAVKDQCAICLYLYATIQDYPSETLFDKFRIPTESTELSRDGRSPMSNGHPDSRGCKSDEDEALIINYHASTKSEATSYPGKVHENRGAFDIVEIHVAPLGAHERWNHCTPLDVFALPSDPASIYVKSRPIIPDMGTSASINVVRRWIYECTPHSHPKCHQSFRRLPRRVLDVGSTESHDQRVRLHISLDEELGDYAALSYCWGGEQSMKLTNATFVEMLDGMSLDSLPQTIQDAIWWTRQLRLHYLWVDVLCIIQDDPPDKVEDIALMHNIYRSALITFSAARARACYDGYRYTTRHHEQSGPIPQAEMLFPCPDGSSGKISIQALKTYDSSSEPINQRGWALQESLLSPRLLVFGSRQMYWICQHVQAANGGKIDLFYPPIQQLPEDIVLAAKADREVINKQAVYEMWLKLVYQYIGRDLSYKEDRLPALAGIASLIQQVLGIEPYLAGLWLGGMPESLEWKVFEPQPQSLTALKGPTWSWASIDGRVHWQEQLLPDTGAPNPYPGFKDTRIVSHRVVPKYSSAPLGEIAWGTITLKGRVKCFGWNGETILAAGENAVGDYIIAMIEPDFSERAVDTDDGDSVLFKMDEGCRNDHSVDAAAIQVSAHAALLLEHLRAKSRYERMGVIEFDFVDGLDYETNIGSFFKGCEERAITLQ